MGNKSLYKRTKHVGIGGMKCPCCGPAPSERKKFFRSAKRRERRAAEKEMNTELDV